MDRRAFIAGALTATAAVALPVLPSAASTPISFTLVGAVFKHGDAPLTQFSEDEMIGIVSQLAERAAQDGISVHAMPSPVDLHEGVVLEAKTRLYQTGQAVTEVFNQLAPGTNHLHILSFFKDVAISEETFQPEARLFIRYAVS